MKVCLLKNASLVYNCAMFVLLGEMQTLSVYYSISDLETSN